MCGIVGFLDTAAALNRTDRIEIIERMTLTLHHRGPDSTGTWIDPDSAIALGHRRLAILDLSTAGHQPMVSHSGRRVLSFNGEIYNHDEIRQVLEVGGHEIAWRGSSDTEVMLEAIDAITGEAISPTCRHAGGGGGEPAVCSQRVSE